LTFDNQPRLFAGRRFGMLNSKYMTGVSYRRKGTPDFVAKDGQGVIFFLTRGELSDARPRFT
jgi:hypothetical protein